MRGLKKKILKSKLDYISARYDIAKLTEATHKRVIKLTKQLNATVNYSFGSGKVNGIIIRNEGDSSSICYDQFELLSKEYEANMAIERMLRHGGKKKQKLKRKQNSCSNQNGS